MSLPKYPAYKESGVNWLGEIPEHWEIMMARRVFEQRRDSSFAEDEQLTASQKYGVVPQKLFMELEDQSLMLALTGLGNFKHVNQNDFVISLRSFQGGIERSCYSGCVSPAYTVLRAVNSIDPQFWAYLLKSKSYISALQTMTDGIRDGKNISYLQFGALNLPIPHVNEQTLIAQFLDRETAKIDDLIAEQEKLITLLDEKRQAMISHAVTKGLNPNAPMKDSGVEWLGEVPESWEVGLFNRYVYVIEGLVNPEQPPYLNMTLIAPNHIESGTGRIIYTETALEQSAESGKYLCKEGDVIYSKIRPALRKACLATKDSLCSADMYPLRTNSKLENRFLLYFILSEPFSALAVLESDRVAMPKINRESLKAVFLAVPPRHEQTEIVTYLNNQTTKIDTLKSEAQRGIELLKERRSALISAAVTGKIDVRGFTNNTEAA